MAKQATTYGFGNTDSWAFGPGHGNGSSGPVRAVAAAPRADVRQHYQEPAVFLTHLDHEQPAVFPEPAEPTAAERDVWDQLPQERRRRSRRYVGKHRA